MNWSKVIKEVLKHNDITVYQLSKTVGVFPSQLYSLVNGNSKNIGFEKGLLILKMHPDFEKLVGCK